MSSFARRVSTACCRNRRRHSHQPIGCSRRQSPRRSAFKMSTLMRRMRSACCASPASGHAAAAGPPRTPGNSRRLICPSPGIARGTIASCHGREWLLTACCWGDGRFLRVLVTRDRPHARRWSAYDRKPLNADMNPRRRRGLRRMFAVPGNRGKRTMPDDGPGRSTRHKPQALERGQADRSQAPHARQRSKLTP